MFNRNVTRFVNKQLRKGESISGNFSVNLKGVENKFALTYTGFDLREKLLNDKSDFDCTLVAPNGAEIQCHQLVLKGTYVYYSILGCQYFKCQ